MFENLQESPPETDKNSYSTLFGEWQRTVATCVADLAAAVGVSKTTIDRALKEPGNPGRNSNGTLNIERWKKYMAERKQRIEQGTLDDSEPAQSVAAELKVARLRKEQAQAEKAELDLAARRGELIPLADAEHAAFKFSSILRARHKRAVTCDLFNALAGAINIPREQLPAILDILEKFHHDFATTISTVNFSDDETL